MRTPCQDAPEAWVGDDVLLRQEAAKECLTCPRFAACREEAEADPPKFGVLGGVDYSPKNGRPRLGRPRNLPTRECEFCGDVFTKTQGTSATQWARRRFCNYSCAQKNAHAVKRAAA